MQASFLGGTARSSHASKLLREYTGLGENSFTGQVNSEAHTKNLVLRILDLSGGLRTYAKEVIPGTLSSYISGHYPWRVRKNIPAKVYWTRDRASYRKRF